MIEKDNGVTNMILNADANNPNDIDQSCLYSRDKAISVELLYSFNAKEEFGNIFERNMSFFQKSNT
jgi:hypothetical protein